MFVACVHVHVKADRVNEFVTASLENARHSIQELGNLRFDVLQQADDPTRFVLYEAYRDAEAAKAHKQTAHYALWRDTVEAWMAEPRQGVIHNSLFPPRDDQWKTPQ